MGIKKDEIVKMIYEDMGISKTECTKLVERFFEIIKSELATGKDVMISGFGKWSVRRKRARNGRNPQTGKAMTIHARKVVTFHCSKKLWGKLNIR